MGSQATYWSTDLPYGLMPLPENAQKKKNGQKRDHFPSHMGRSLILAYSQTFIIFGSSMVLLYIVRDSRVLEMSNMILDFPRRFSWCKVP